VVRSQTEEQAIIAAASRATGQIDVRNPMQVSRKCADYCDRPVLLPSRELHDSGANQPDNGSLLGSTLASYQKSWGPRKKMLAPIERSVLSLTIFGDEKLVQSD
jgi:hypothetical protein